MTAPSYNTWTGDVANGVNPYRPAVGDMGGNSKQNDLDYPPSPNEPSADEWNQKVSQIASLANLSAAALIDVRFAAGVPFVFAVYSANPSLATTDVGCADTATGKVTLTIAATKIPDIRFGAAFPQATGDNTGVGYRSAAQTLVCEVRTGGTLADINFIAVWG